MNQETVKDLVVEALRENERLFLIDLKFSPGNKITVVVDGDDGVPLKECVRISRHLEHNLDREVEDFSLEVTSPGATEPLVNSRQYKKHLGRTLKVTTQEEKLEGKLIELDDESVTITWKAREPKPIGKGKTTVVKQAMINYKDIKEAKVKIIF
ncbi:MAG: ribosome assembly cofactor RimP [Flavobacteriaceae bacterium]|nr:ribosome assembly cofactor RimP [Flavobacteriaceae bacterium]